MNEYYDEIEHLIKRFEINKKAMILRNNSDTLKTNWEIGKFIVEAQGGREKTKYGNSLIKEWSLMFTKNYGSNYSYSNMARFRQFYLSFPNFAPVGRNLNWTHIKYLLPIKNENKRNYYINLIIEQNLSKNELIKTIKDCSYERLLEKPKHIKIISEENMSLKEYNIKQHIKNPIIIKLNKDEIILNEHDLQMLILSKLKNFFEELGFGFTFVGNEYKIKFDNKIYRIDLLLFNVEMNSYVVVELKMRELKKEDKSQVEFYMDLVNKTLKREFHNKTKGIIVTKKQDSLIFEFVSTDDIIPITYLIKS